MHILNFSYHWLQQICTKQRLLCHAAESQHLTDQTGQMWAVTEYKPVWKKLKASAQYRQKRKNFHESD